MTDDPVRYRITDIHSHVIPGVDDGAQDVGEALVALRRLMDEGVTRVVATPHFRASLLERSDREADRLHRFEDAFWRLVDAVEKEGMEIGIERGVEFKLDAPGVDLSDARLRLAGTRYALVEFSSFQLPPYAGNQLRAVQDRGWVPVLAHPERYAGVTAAWDQVERWVAEGVLLQMNARSLLGWYGAEPQIAARELLRLGWVCCLASDYHARGKPDFGTALDLLEQSRVVFGPAEADPSDSEGEERGAAADQRHAAIKALVSDNPERILADAPTEPVRPLEVPEYERKRRRGGWLR